MTGPHKDIKQLVIHMGEGKTLVEAASLMGISMQTAKKYCGLLGMDTTRKSVFLDRVRELASNGRTKGEIAEEVGICDITVAKYARSLGIKLKRANSAPDQPTARQQQMISMYQQGVVLEKIGQKFSITRERVRQILRKHGFDRYKGGQSKKSSVKQAKLDIERNALFQAKYGSLSVDLVDQLKKDGVIRAYQCQQKNASVRGIEWKFDFPTWFAIWQTSGKLHLRGKGIGRYVMSRLNDEGPYEIGNVHIQLATENSREGFAKSIGKVKANSGVFLLYPGREGAWCAKFGKKSLGFFKTEQEAAIARNEYLESIGRVTGCALGAGKGYSLTKRGTYYMQCAGEKHTEHKTPEEARASYLAAVDRAKAKRLAHLAPEAKAA